MAENKTKPTAVSPAQFIAAVENGNRRADAEALSALMAEVSGEPPVMWGPSIVGFGRYRYAYESGRTGEICRLGFSPRKPHLVLYCGYEGQDELLARLGKLKTSTGGCIYVNRLADLDPGLLREFLVKSWARSLSKHPEPVPA